MNKVVLIGRLTRDPELKYAAGSGTAITNFTLAVNRPKSKDKKQAADFITCIAFGKTAENIAQYLLKGKQLAVSGAIRTGSYEGQDGIKRYTTEVYIDSFDFVDNGQAVNKNNSGFTGTPYDEEAGNEDMTPVYGDDDIPY